jgi:3-hydroxybutyryl-CoA dehydratase
MIKPGEKYSIPFVVNAPVYEGFITTFNDRNPLHTDFGFAVSKGFKGKVMHGNILNGFLSYFIGECLPIKNVAIQHQTIKFALPVYLNDELIFNAEVAEVFETVNAYLFKFYFQNSEGKKVARGEIRIGLLL